MDELVDVTITAPDAEWLADFTRQLVEDGLAACGNIVPAIRSIYRWEGKVEDDTEALVILHTRASHVEAIIERTLAVHPYDVPHVLAHPVTAVNPAYRDWLRRATAQRIVRG